MSEKPKPENKKISSLVSKTLPPLKKNKKYGVFFLLGTKEERDFFVENLSLLLASGMDILSALTAIRGGMSTKKMKGMIDDLKEDIENGIPLWRALSDTSLLSSHILYLVRLGEETGKLSDNLKVIVLQLQKERDFRSKLRGAMMYPVLVLSVTGLVGISIAWFVLPRLAQVFRDLEIDLPLITQVLISVGDFLRAYGAIVVPLGLFASAIAFYYLFFGTNTKFVGQAILFVLPGIRKIIVQVELARFGFILGTLLSAGIQITTALDSLHQGTGFHKYKLFYAALRASLSEGNSFQKSFALYHASDQLIPVPIQQMIISAERSGRLAETCFKIGDAFEKKTEISTKNLSTLLEPILLVIIWLMVLMVALAVVLPLYNLIGGINP